jgi:hypothetical protein
MIILVTALIFASCRSKGGSSGSSGGGDVTPPPPPPILVDFTTTQQAAASSSAVQETRTAADAVFLSAMDLGLAGKLTAGIGSQFKPIQPLDPTLAGIVDASKMSARSPVLKKVAQKISQKPAATAPLSAAITTPVNEVLTTGFCDNVDGQIAILGQNNYADLASTSLQYTYDVTFTKCRDDITFSQLDGTMHVVNDEDIFTAAFTSDMTVDLTQQMFSAIDYATLTQRTVMKGAFGNSDQVSSGSKTSNGSFAVTTPALVATPEKVVTYTFVNSSDGWSITHNLDGSDTRTDQISGQVVVRTDIAGAQVGLFNMSLNLTDRLDTLNDVPGTKKRLLNGTIDTAWTPDLSASGCLPGQMTISTSETTPQTFTLASGYTCPVAGSLSINNATIAYGASIQVGLTNNQTQTFATCAALAQEGGVCTF